MSQLTQLVSKNPRVTACVVTATLGIATPHIIAGAALVLAGFGAEGVTAASLASIIQSSIGNVAAGGVFATLQSAGTAGAGMAVVNGAVQGASVAGLLSWGPGKWFNVPTEAGETEDSEAEEVRDEV